MMTAIKAYDTSSSGSFAIDKLNNGASGDDNSSYCSFGDEDDYLNNSRTFSSYSGAEPTERDEKKEVYKMSAKDTRRVQLMRLAVTLALLLTALGVTLTTYKFLKEEENNNFETAVSC